MLSGRVAAKVIRRKPLRPVLSAPPNLRDGWAEHTNCGNGGVLVHLVACAESDSPLRIHTLFLPTRLSLARP